jgi:3'-5' exoribonuclease
MATAEAAEILGLDDIVVGRSGVCFAVLVKHEEKISSRQEPYVACVFRARNVTRTAKVWANNQCINDVRACRVGSPYRLTAVGENAYGSDLKILGIEEADESQKAELIASSEFAVKELCDELRETIEAFEDRYLRELVRNLMNIHRDLFKKMPAAKSFHHAYNAGLLEHVWSLTRICNFLADHYAEYYRHLDPPLNKDIILSAAIVHDIGKLVELEYDPFEPRYTTPGQLIGHVVIGRDMVRDAARRIDGFPDETLMLLEHAILAHHGKREWGAPILPQTVEALVVSFADDLDAKINAAARARMLSRTTDAFTEPVKPLEGRSIYKGVPIAGPLAEETAIDE